MPKAYKKTRKCCGFAASIAAAKLVADFHPHAVEHSHHRGGELKQIRRTLDEFFINQFARHFVAHAIDIQSLAGCEMLNRFLRCDRINHLQRATASHLRDAKFKLPHTGQLCGNTMSVAVSGRLSGTMATICGITSPARRMITVSPTLMPKRAISSALCKASHSIPSRRQQILALSAPLASLHLCGPLGNQPFEQSHFSCGEFIGIAQRGRFSHKT